MEPSMDHCNDYEYSRKELWRRWWGLFLSNIHGFLPDTRGAANHPSKLYEIWDTADDRGRNADGTQLISNPIAMGTTAAPKKKELQMKVTKRQKEVVNVAPTARSEDIPGHNGSKGKKYYSAAWFKTLNEMTLLC